MLVVQIEGAQNTGTTISTTWLWQERRYRDLLDTISERVQKVTPKAADLVTSGQQTVVSAAIDGQLSLFDRMAGTLPTSEVSVSWNTVPKSTLDALIGFASDGSPLADMYNAIAPDMAKAATQILVVASGTGINPKAAARSLENVLNVSRARAETIARTEMLRAAREATRQAHLENRDVLEGWIWYSARNNRTCAACWAMHGTLHPVGDTLDDHVNGCCVAVPRVKAWGEILGDPNLPDTRPTIPTGADEFANLSEERQKAILGPTLYGLYADEEIILSDVVTQENNERWGTMRRPATVAEAKANASARG